MFRKQNEEKITSLINKPHNHKKTVVIITTVLLSVVGTFFFINNVTAATSPWTQTDWSGGTASGTVTTTVTTYASESNIDTSTSGEFSLSETSGWSGTYSSWGYRKSLTVTNSGSAETNYQVEVDVTYDSDMQADFDDIRFTNSGGTALDYWLKEKVDSTSATFWVEVDSIAGSGDTTIYMYYGNSGASSASSGTDTFIEFVDFNTNGVTSYGGSQDTNPGSYSIQDSGATLYIYGNSWKATTVNYTVTGNEALEAEFRSTGDEPEINGIGFDTDLNLSPTYLYQTYGTQNYGSYQTVPQYTGSGAYETITAVLDDFTGTFPYIMLPNDADAGGLSTAIYYSNVRIRKYTASGPSISATGSEEGKYSSTGTLTSNIFDAEFPADWGTLTYTTSGSGTVTVKVRTDSNSDMSGATAWGSCSGISSGGDISSEGCVTDTDQYLQYQVTLEPSGANTPTFEDFSIAFTASDQVAPTTNASSLSITGVADGAWTNSEPTITWTAGADNAGGNGLLGYCISLDEGNIGVSSSLDPASSGGALGGLDDGVSQAHCPFIATGTSLDLSGISGLTLTSNKQYYVSIKAVDLSGNIYTGASGTYQDLVSFKYDGTAPTNVTFISTPSSSFGSVNDMFFTWPTSGGSAASDSHSGIIGWQYSLNGTSNWTGPDTEATLGIDYIEDDGSTSEHYLTEGDDGANVVVGNNTIYFRAVDEAGNYATAVSGGISYGGAAPTFGGEDAVTVTPSTNTSNSFALSWPAATANTGSIQSYYYMINTTPPSTLATLKGNSSLYIPTTSRSVSAGVLTGSVKGSNNVYVVAVDDSDNYSPSNYISGSYTLNSSNPDPVQNLAASDTSIKTEEIWRAALAWQAPDYQGNGDLTYKIERSTNNSTWTDVATTTGLSYTDTVDTSQLYYYRVGVYDTSDDSTNNPTYATSVSITPKGTFDEPPSLSSGPTVSNITTKSATVSWSTSRTSDSKIQYGTSSGDYFDEEPSKSEQVTSHEILLTNLDPGTKYYYKAKWTDEDGNTGISDEKTFNTDPAPEVANVTASDISITSAIINFTASNAASATIVYGPSTAYGGTVTVNTSTTEESEYSVRLTGLEDGVEYNYKLILEDAEGEEYEFENHVFTTLPRPRISDVRIQQVRGTAQPTVLITWSTNTEVSSIVSYYPDGNPSAVRDEVNVALVEGEHRMIVRALLPQTRYVLQVSGRDIVGNEALSDTQSFTTATDTRPPLISNLRIEGSNIPSVNGQPKSQLVVTWDTDEKATSQVEYGEGTGSTYSQKTQEDNNLTFNHLVVISGLTPSKVYHLRAISKDEIGNITESIDSVTITPKATDNALDLVISNLQEAFGFIGGLQQ